jgi:hypothetical protein
MREEGITLIRKYLSHIDEELPDECIAVAQRHRWTEGKGQDKGKKVWKTSFKHYVPGFSMEFQYIKTLLESHGGEFFDHSVYGPKEQLYSCVFNCKDKNTKGDNVTLEPVTGHATEDFLVQHVGEDSQPLDGKALKEAYEEEQRQIKQLDSASTLSVVSTVSLVSSANPQTDNTIAFENFLQVVAGMSPTCADDAKEWAGWGQSIKSIGRYNKFSTMQIFKLVDGFSKTKPKEYDADAVMKLVA